MTDPREPLSFKGAPVAPPSSATRMTCPRCSVAELSPLTGICELCGFAPEASVAVEPADATIELARRQLAHEFEFEEPIGRGVRSHVFRAREKSSKRSVILKVLPRGAGQPDAEESFRATLGAFSGFDHPHLVPVLRHGSTDSLFWYAMEPLDSTSLRELLRERKRMGPRSCRRIITQVVSALEYLHRRGVVHGAIKPENVFVDREGWVHLCDPTFYRAVGTSRRSTPALGSGEVRTPAPPPAKRPPWVAPEVHAGGEPLPAADQFALAALTYECLAGKPPAEPPEPLHRVRSDISPAIARAVDRALDPDPWRRYPSCADFLWALEENAVAVPDAQPTGAIRQDVVLIDHWEPPEDPWRPVTALVRVGVGIAAAVVLWFSVPYVWGLLRPGPISGVSVANTAPATAPTTSEVPPSAAAVPGATQGAPTGAAGAAPERRPSATGPTSTLPPSPIVERPPATAPPPRPRPAAGAAASAGSARLFVNSAPWGQLYIDGVLVGNTPKADLEVSAGTRVLRVVRQGFAPFERTVQLAPGETLRLTDIELEPRRP